jgi:5-methylcytosine-specific restriction endonuclease McrA
MLFSIHLAAACRTTSPMHLAKFSRRLVSGVRMARLRRQLACFSDAPLIVELVPATAWCKNLRSVLSTADWDRLRKDTYRRAAYRCEICGEQGPTHPVECHERWQYDDSRRLQRLLGLVALCPGCHHVKHLGRSYVTGDADAALTRLARINGWTAAQVATYVDLVFSIWSLRSDVEWRLDLSWLDSIGMTAPKA